MVQLTKSTTIFKIKNITIYLLVISCGVFFYLHKFISPFSEDLLSKIKVHKELKTERTIVLNKLIENSKDSNLGKEFELIKNKTNKAYQNVKIARSNEKIFGFKSLHFFIERFGLALLIFVYAFYNLIRSFYYDSKNYGGKVFHTFVISVSLYYFFWIFQPFQDYSKGQVIIITILSALFIMLGVNLFTKYKISYINKLKGDVRKLSLFTALNTKASKTEEAFDLLENLADTQK